MGPGLGCKWGVTGFECIHVFQEGCTVSKFQGSSDSMTVSPGFGACSTLPKVLALRGVSGFRSLGDSVFLNCLLGLSKDFRSKTVKAANIISMVQEMSFDRPNAKPEE